MERFAIAIQDGKHPGRYAKIDEISRAFVMLDHTEHKIHTGDSYIVNEALDIAINGVVDVRITTPNTDVVPHFLLGFDTETEFEWWFFETAVISVAGTVYKAVNQNRRSENVATVTVDIIENASLALADDDTNFTGTTELMHGYSGSGREGGSNSFREEIMLKRNTTYVFRAVANAAGWIHGNMQWYEDTPCVDSGL